MNVLEEYIKFEKKNISTFAKEVLTEEYFDDELFEKLLNSYVSVRYYGFYIDHSKKLEESILEELKKTTAKIAQGADEETKTKIKNMYLMFGYIMAYDGVLPENDKKLVSSLCNFRIKLFSICDMIFPENMNKLLSKTKKKRKDFYNFFKSNEFSVKRKNTSKDNVYRVIMKYKIKFPKLYSEYAIDRVFYSGTINEDRLQVMYYLVGNIIMKDINKCIYDNYYLIDFASSLFENKDKLEALIKIIDNDAFKSQSIFIVSYNDFAKYGTNIKDMIKEGCKFALNVGEEDISGDPLLFELFEYILVPQDSDYCNKKNVNDKIIYEK